MASLSTLARIRQERHLSWLATFRGKVQKVAGRCVDLGLGIEAVLLFGSPARGDFDGHSDIDLIVVGIPGGTLKSWRMPSRRRTWGMT